MWLVVEFVPRPLWFTPRVKNVRQWPWSSRYLKDIFWGLHYPRTWSKGLCGGRGKRGAMVEKGRRPWQKNVVIIIFWWFFDGEWMKTKEWSNLNFLFFIFFSHNALLWTCIKPNKKSAHSLCGAFLFVHIWLTPSEKPKIFQNFYFWEIRPWKLDHQVWTWEKVIFHDVNRPLVLGSHYARSITHWWMCKAWEENLTFHTSVRKWIWAPHSGSRS